MSLCKVKCGWPVPDGGEPFKVDEPQKRGNNQHIALDAGETHDDADMHVADPHDEHRRLQRHEPQQELHEPSMLVKLQCARFAVHHVRTACSSDM